MTKLMDSYWMDSLGYDPNQIFYSDELFEDHKYAKKFPMMNSYELRELGLNMQKYGLQDSIILYEGKILDGRNRYHAGHMFNVPLKFAYYNSKLKPKTFIYIKNWYRRQLTPPQRVELALEMLKEKRKEAAKRKALTQFKKEDKKNKNQKKNRVVTSEVPTVKDFRKGRAVDIIAQEFKMSHNTLRKAEKIKEAKKTDPEIKELWNRFKNMEISLEDVFRVVQEKNSKEIHEKFNKKNKGRNNIVKKEEVKKLKNSKNSKMTTNEIINSLNSRSKNNKEKDTQKVEELNRVTSNSNNINEDSQIDNSQIACCFNCKNVKIKTCTKCPRMCFIFTCEKDYKITFHCDDFEF